MNSRKRVPKIRCFEVPIAAGTHKGKKILIPDLPATRSTKSILRESLFDTLQYDIYGKSFVEVFAGSGSVGLEALSRGADKAYFIEHDPAVFDILMQNINSISARQATAKLADSFSYLPSIVKGMADRKERGYFYFDPPFSIRDGMDDIYDKTVEAMSMLDHSICEKIIVEHMTGIELPKHINRFELEKKRSFGKSSLSYYSTDI